MDVAEPGPDPLGNRSDYAIAALAQALNETADYELFLNRSQRYLNLWSTAEQFYCPRFANGTFMCKFSKVYTFTDYFIEGDAWHYRFYGRSAVAFF